MYLHIGVIWSLEPFDFLQHTSIIPIIHNFFRGSIFSASVSNWFYPSSTNMNESCKNVVNNGGETLHTLHKKIDTKFHGFFYQNHTHTHIYSFHCTKRDHEF